MSETQATRPPKPPKHELLTRAEERALNQLENVGGRDYLLDELLHITDLSPDEERLLSHLSDPVHQNRGLGPICADAGFSVARFLKFLQRAKGAKALLNSYDRVFAKGADVAGDAMELARVREMPCRACDQLGTITKKDREGKESIEKCEACGGRGTWIKEPTVAQQKLALQLVGMLVQSGGLAVNVTQNAQTSAVADARAASSSGLVNHSFMDSLRANSDAAIRQARALKPGSAGELGPGTVIEARFNEEAPAKEVAHATTESHPRESGAVHPAVVDGLVLQRPAGSAGPAPAGTPPVDPGPRAVVPQLGIPAGIRRPPPVS